jgi:hypothetical protein
MVTWSSLADVLPLDAPMSYQGGCFATTAWFIFGQFLLQD